MKKFVTDEQVEEEISRLQSSEAVKLARLEQRKKYQRRQYLYMLRSLEKRGMKLMEEGITEESLRGEEDYE